MSREKTKKKLTEWVSHLFDWLSSGQETWGVAGVQEHGGTWRRMQIDLWKRIGLFTSLEFRRS